MSLKHRGIVQLGYVRIGLNDSRLTKSREFYSDTLGLLETQVSPGRACFRCWHEPQQFSLVIDETPENGLIEVGFQVRDDEDLDQIQARVEATGIPVTRCPADTPLAGLGASISFVIPGGQTLRLFAENRILGYPTGHDSPDWNTPRQLRGTPAPLFINHVAITTPDPAATINFLKEVLEFRLSEILTKDDGSTPLAGLLFRMSKDVGGQEISVFPGDAGRLHHIAFTKEDASDILTDGQYLREDGVNIDIYGPTRQSFGKTFSLHFFDPMGVRLELCSGGRVTENHPEFEPVRWTESNLNKALSFYDNKLNDSFLAASL
ncbi:MAG: VOC family protein [Gammaproteobacteria bacterium]|nr:VOC family protein [Gammaproteobacteria bacterium]